MSRRSTDVAVVLLIVGLIVIACAAPAAPTPAPTPQRPTPAAPAGPQSQLTREQRLVEAAKAGGEKEVTLWVTSLLRSTDPRGLEETFMAKYPFLKLTVNVLSIAIEPRIIEEYSAGKYTPDVVIMPIRLAARLKNKGGILQEYEYPNLPNNLQGQPAHGFWRVAYGDIYAPAVNTNLVKQDEIPKSWDDVSNARWRGRAMISTGGASWIIGYAYEIGDLTKAGAKWDRTITFWKKVMDTVRPRVVEGFNAPLNLIASGEAAIMLVSAGGPVVRLVQLGAPVAFGPIKKAYTTPLIVALPKNPPHPNAAKLFIDFLTSAEGALLLANQNGDPSPHPDAAQKTFANQYYKSIGIDAYYVPDELVTENLYIEAEDIWIKEVLGRK